MTPRLSPPLRVERCEDRSLPSAAMPCPGAYETPSRQSSPPTVVHEAPTQFHWGQAKPTMMPDQSFSGNNWAGRPAADLGWGMPPGGQFDFGGARGGDAFGPRVHASDPNGGPIPGGQAAPMPPDAPPVHGVFVGSHPVDVVQDLPTKSPRVVSETETTETAVIATVGVRPPAERFLPIDLSAAVKALADVGFSAESGLDRALSFDGSRIATAIQSAPAPGSPTTATLTAAQLGARVENPAALPATTPSGNAAPRPDSPAPAAEVAAAPAAPVIMPHAPTGVPLAGAIPLDLAGFKGGARRFLGRLADLGTAVRERSSWTLAGDWLVAAVVLAGGLAFRAVAFPLRRRALIPTAGPDSALTLRKRRGARSR
jgi:hypothetical protein